MHKRNIGIFSVVIRLSAAIKGTKERRLEGLLLFHHTIGRNR